MKKFLCFLLMMNAALVVHADIVAVTEDLALDLATQTDEAEAFLTHYGRCEDCPDGYAGGKTNLLGCAEYGVRDDPKNNAWIVEYWVSSVCAFRYGTKATKIAIAIDRATGSVISAQPSLKLIRDPRYCEQNRDCSCLSGSGLPFVGCANSLHGPSHWSGSYACKKCTCVNNVCRSTDE